MRIVILISGRGSNMMSLVEAACEPGFPAQVVAVLANRADAAGLAWAAAQGLTTGVVEHKAYAGREPFEAALDAALAEHRPDMICLAGFMRVLTAGFVGRWHGRMINIHPSLLPSYKGLHTHERALADGVRIAGCTVHFVVPEMDAGPIIAQAGVPVLDTDTPETLATRVLSAEHKLYPHALRLVASGEARLVDGRVQVDPQMASPETHAQLFSPPLPSGRRNGPEVVRLLAH